MGELLAKADPPPPSVYSRSPLGCLATLGLPYTPSEGVVRGCYLRLQLFYAGAVCLLFTHQIAQNQVASRAPRRHDTSPRRFGASDSSCGMYATGHPRRVRRRARQPRVGQRGLPPDAHPHGPRHHRPVGQAAARRGPAAAAAAAARPVAAMVEAAAPPPSSPTHWHCLLPTLATLARAGSSSSSPTSLSWASSRAPSSPSSPSTARIRPGGCSTSGAARPLLGCG